MSKIEDILNGFKPSDSAPREQETTLTLWVSKKDKDRYQRLQKMSGRKLSKVLHQVILVTLDAVEKKVS